MRVILVPVAARPESELALDVAFRMAKALYANVTACHVRAERRERRPAAAPSGDRGGHGARAEGEEAALTSTAAHELFVRAATRFDFEIVRRATVRRQSCAIWHEMVGTPSRVLGIVGPVTDLCVVSRPKARSAGRAQEFLMAALLHSARPVLVVPQRRLNALGRRIVIAWNQSVDAAAAVAAAMPILQGADSVVIATSGAESHAGPKASYLGQYLAQWNIDAERVRTKGRDERREIESVYRETGADLLVMGAYSRHWFRERIFGGLTQHMLFKTDIPVLMLHR